MKNAVVIGGTKGIGWEITKSLAMSGFNVVTASRSGKVPESHERVIAKPIDVRSPKSLLTFGADLKRDGFVADLWINCAGISIWKPLEKVDEAFWDDMVDTNLKGTFFGCQAAMLVLKEGGAIINISSLAGKRGSANNSVYCATKFGVNGITQSLAKELGPRGIRVNAVCPVYVETPMILEQLTDPDSPSLGVDVKTYLAQFSKSQAALQRLPMAREVAETCLFLGSERASAITGQCINVDCGVMPQ